MEDGAIMSKKVDEGLEKIKCPPQHVPWSNPNEELASRKPATSQNITSMRTYDAEAVAMEGGVPFDEKEKITGSNHTHNLVESKEGIGIEYPDTSGGQCMDSPLRRPDASPSAEALGTGVHHPTVGRRTRVPERVFPGAFREGGLDSEDEDEEDEHTIQSNTEPPVPPPIVSAKPIDTDEEERRHQETMNQAIQKVQDEINQALARERQQAVVAEAIPQCDRRWIYVGAFLLLALILSLIHI